MVFKDEFAWTHKLNNNWSLNRTVDVGLRANLEQSKALQKNLTSLFDQAAQSQMATTAELQKEFTYQSQRFAQQMADSSADMVDAVERSAEGIAASIQQMSDYLGGGLCEIRWLVERLSLVSVEILRVLLESLDNKSRQLLEQGIKWYERIEPELAKKCFLKALEANKTNYFAYQYLGFIAVDQNDADQAIRNFDLAQKIAETDYHKSIALSHLARSCQAKGDLNKAADTAKQATEANPHAAKFWYEWAGYSARLGNKESLLALKEAIERDWTYFTIVAIDNDFDLVREDVNQLLSELREQQRRKAQQAMGELNRIIDTANKVCVDSDLSESRRVVSNLSEAYKQNNVFVYNDIIPQAEKCHADTFELAEKAIRQQLADKRKTLTLLESDRDNRIRKLLGDLERDKEKIAWEKPASSAVEIIVGVIVCGILSLGIPLAVTLMGGAQVIQLRAGTIQVIHPSAKIIILSWFLLLIVGLIVTLNARYRRRVTSLQNRITAKERETEPLKQSVIDEHNKARIRVEGELNELERLLEKCRNKQHF